jgi:serine/threonine protein kinase
LTASTAASSPSSGSASTAFRVRLIQPICEPRVLVVRDHLKVLDFGLSIHTAERERADWAGTLLYMAPEVLRGEAPSERCDLYALGMIAYELLMGAHPFLEGGCGGRLARDHAHAATASG